MMAKFVHRTHMFEAVLFKRHRKLDVKDLVGDFDVCPHTGYPLIKTTLGGVKLLAPGEYVVKRKTQNDPAVVSVLTREVFEARYVEVLCSDPNEGVL